MTNELLQEIISQETSMVVQRPVPLFPQNPFRRLQWKVQLFFRRRLERKTFTRLANYLSADVRVAIRIWTRVIRHPESVLIYNPKTDECFAEWIDPACPVYLFLENSRIRIVNTVVGYDIMLDQVTADWCFRFFTREVNRRRTAFKRDALSKVAHSLDGLEVRLVDSEKQVHEW
jgi:hypothetical protein